MKQIKIQTMKPGTVSGVEVQIPVEEPGYRETYFEWTASTLIARLKSIDVSGGILKAWHHVPVFREVESHTDSEMFYFISGVALMLFIDYKGGSPDLETAQIVRIQPGTQLVIPDGKGHFVPVAEGSEPVTVIVVSPKMDAPRLSLPQPVEGIQ